MVQPISKNISQPGHLHASSPNRCENQRCLKPPILVPKNIYQVIESNLLIPDRWREGPNDFPTLFDVGSRNHSSSPKRAFLHPELLGKHV